MTSPKLLIQAYKFPPVQAVSVRRLYYLNKYLCTAFHEVHVQTSSNCSFFPLDETYAVSSPYHYTIPTNDLRTVRAQQGRSAAHLDLHEKTTLLYTQLHPFYHAYPFILFTGDGGRTYIRESVKHASKLIRKEGITHILSSYRPWADHVIAYRLKKRFPKLIWIADFRDLAVDPVRRDIWWPQLQKWWQKRLLQRADILTTVSDGLARQLKPYHQEVVVLRNGLSELPSGFMTAPSSPRFTITYTGALYPDLQSAAPLFATLRQLLDEGELNPYHLALHYAGKDEIIWEQWLRKYSLGHFNVSHGMLSFAAAEKLQQESQINLLLSWSAQDYGGIMTAKLGSYLTAARPIICLLNGPADQELNQLIEDTGGGFVYPSEDAASAAKLRHFLLDAYRSWVFSGALPWRSNPQQLQPYTWEEQVQHLLTNEKIAL